MSFKNKYINIIDWAGKNLLNAPYDSPDVDKVLDANRCKDCTDDEIRGDIEKANHVCPECNDSGYSGDFEVEWEDESDKDECNVYEYINY